MSMRKNVNLFWFRRDLRLEDNRGLFECLRTQANVQPIFIFDSAILEKLDRSDRRVPFIYSTLDQLKKDLQSRGSDLWIFHGASEAVFEKLLTEHEIESLYCNTDYEPYAKSRDQKIAELMKKSGKKFFSFKDQVIFEKSEILSDQMKPYLVFTPYKKKWLKELGQDELQVFNTEKLWKNLNQNSEVLTMPTLLSMGFDKSLEGSTEYLKLSSLPKVGDALKLNSQMLKNYDQERNFPSRTSATSHLGLHLRFGTISIRKLVSEARKMKAEVWLSELIWREFFMQILWHFPETEKQSFRPAYDTVAWRTSKEDFKKWTEGQTGYPIVDAGIRELLATGYMHNRVRMITASFLTKHLLIYWRDGERFFAQHLLDFDLSANVGNWQWAAGTGCDAAPYFRIFNPEEQTKKFDSDHAYIKKWVPEYQTSKYPAPMVEHKFARERALAAFKKALKSEIE